VDAYYAGGNASPLKCPVNTGHIDTPGGSIPFIVPPGFERLFDPKNWGRDVY
jgi:hypothetical protein